MTEKIVFDRFRLIFKTEKEFYDFITLIKRFEFILTTLNYARIKGIYMDRDRSGDHIVIYLEYTSKDLDEIMIKAKRMYEFLRKQNPEILKKIKIKAIIPKELSINKV